MKIRGTAWFCRVCTTVVAAAVLASSLNAAGPAGTLIGLVTDPAGGVVPDAAVTVRNQDTGRTQEVRTGGAEYSVPLLPPGLYEVSVEAPKFRRLIHSDVRLDADATVRIDAQLEFGELRQEILVTAGAPMAQTDTSAVEHLVTQREITGLPLNERNFLAFTLLAPGVLPPADGSQNSTQGAAINVNGAREQSNNFLLDGVDNNDLSINFYSVLPSVDAVEQFQLQTSNSSAEFGRSAGGQVNAVLRSGGNQPRGSAFWFIRNRHLDARNFFDLPSCDSARAGTPCGEIPGLIAVSSVALSADRSGGIARSISSLTRT